jgi:hypothetical protein
MRTKAVIKKIAALGTGLAMMGATMMGAMAADLSAYPGLFLKDNKFNAAIVVGDQAVASDVVGAIDLAASLQYASRTQKTVSVGGTTSVSASDGVEVSATGNHLTLLEELDDVESSFKKADLPVLLADGTVEDDSSGTDYDYTQKLEPAGDNVTFGIPDEDVFGDKPGIYLDQSAGAAYTITVEFESDLNATALDNSEKITIMGKTFTFDPEMESGDETLVMYASDKTETVAVGQTKTITLKDGTSMVVELVGANSDKETATIRVDGKSYSKTSGDTITASGTSIYINDVFTYNIPTPGAAVEFFVGSEKVEIDAQGTLSDVVIDDETVSGVKAEVNSGDLEEIDKIIFTVTPSEFDADEAKYLQLGEKLMDPLFGTFKMDFAGMTPALKDTSKSKISLTRSGDDYKLSFVNKDAEDYNFVLFHSASCSAAVAYDTDFAAKAENLTKDKIFILNEGDVSKVYKLISVVTDSGVKKANIRDMHDNSEFKVKATDEIGDTGVLVDYLYDGTTDYMELSGNTSLQITTQFDGVIDIANPAVTHGSYALQFTEGTVNFDDLAAGDKLIMKVNVSGDSSDGDEDITIVDLDFNSANNVRQASDVDNKVQYGVSKFGTYFERERDTNGAYLDIYYPEDETSYHVFFMPTAATTSTTAGGDTVTYYEYNKIEVGAAKLASEIVSVEAQNLIVVGGPCANSVAAKLSGNPGQCAAGFTEGSAILRLVQNGANVAILVAGYSADDTRRATAVLANYADYALKGTEMVVKGTSLTDITVSGTQ